MSLLRLPPLLLLACVLAPAAPAAAEAFAASWRGGPRTFVDPEHFATRWQD